MCTRERCSRRAYDHHCAGNTQAQELDAKYVKHDAITPLAEQMWSDGDVKTQFEDNLVSTSAVLVHNRVLATRQCHSTPQQVDKRGTPLLVYHQITFADAPSALDCIGGRGVTWIVSSGLVSHCRQC